MATLDELAGCPRWPADRGTYAAKPSCTHNQMVPNNAPCLAWKCAACGYVYGSENPSPEPLTPTR